MDKHKLVSLDIECFTNYFSVGLKSFCKTKAILIELYNDCLSCYSYDDFSGNIQRLENTNAYSVINDVNLSHTIVTFNGKGYDFPVLSAFMAGYCNQALKNLSDNIIVNNASAWDLYRDRNNSLQNIEVDHIDLMRLQKSSLKMASARIDCYRLQNLPFEPDHIVQDCDLHDLRKYLMSDDLNYNIELFNVLRKDIDLRVAMSKKYDIDLRSKSNANICDTLIKKLMRERYNIKAHQVEPTTRSYVIPDNISFQHSALIDLATHFVNGDYRLVNNKVKLYLFDHDKNEYSAVSKIKLDVYGSTYTFGLGGIHSNEKSITHICGEDEIIKEIDVASYYPQILINNNLYPEHLGQSIMILFKELVSERLEAKKTGDKVTADALKIVINSFYGKFSDIYSPLCSPYNTVAATITGQLTLIMLVERLALAGIRTISANTDGIVVRYNKHLEWDCQQVIDQWELDTNYKLEHTPYQILASRDVNAYFAQTTTGKIKGKGIFKDQASNPLENNPEFRIVIHAVKQYVCFNVPIEQTILNHTNMFDFVAVRNVKGGAYKPIKGDTLITSDGDNEHKQILGKVVRFYYATGVTDAIYYLSNDNKVSNTTGAKPLMVTNGDIEQDIFYGKYIDNAKKLLKEIGYI